MFGEAHNAFCKAESEDKVTSYGLVGQSLLLTSGTQDNADAEKAWNSASRKLGRSFTLLSLSVCLLM